MNRESVMPRRVAEPLDPEARWGGYRAPVIPETDDLADYTILDLVTEDEIALGSLELASVEPATRMPEPSLSRCFVRWPRMG